jgi:hypothetical protein
MRSVSLTANYFQTPVLKIKQKIMWKPNLQVKGKRDFHLHNRMSCNKSNVFISLYFLLLKCANFTWCCSVQYNTQTESSHACTFAYHNFEISTHNRTEFMINCVCVCYLGIQSVAIVKNWTRIWAQKMAVRGPYANTVLFLAMVWGSEKSLSEHMHKAKYHSLGIHSQLAYLERTSRHFTKS